jgi:hypothetical protein
VGLLIGDIRFGLLMYLIFFKQYPKKMLLNSFGYIYDHSQKLPLWRNCYGL